jgi:hypothetical protein
MRENHLSLFETAVKFGISNESVVLAWDRLYDSEGVSALYRDNRGKMKKPHKQSTGAKSKTIKQQFLFEAIMICQLGGILGVILGILIGNIMSMITESPFTIPWNWMIVGLLLCLIVGLASGYLPAVKASRLDPIEALRYE